MFLLTQSTSRWAQAIRPRSKRQIGVGQDLVSALATAKHTSCCRSAKRTLSIRDCSTLASRGVIQLSGCRRSSSHFSTPGRTRPCSKPTKASRVLRASPIK